MIFSSLRSLRSLWIFVLTIAMLCLISQPVYAVAPLVNTSSLTTATQPSTEKHLILTSDGTLHAFINTGSQATTCAGTPAGLTWMYSTNGGTSWSCGANLNTAITLFASVTSDSSDNLYVTYSVATTGASASNDVFYRKLTKGSGATWTVGAERTVLDAGASVGYSYAVIEKENTNNRLWLAVRYFDATNYQIPVYYSSDLTDNPSWTQSISALDTAGTQSAAHWPSIAKFGSKLAVIYTNNSQIHQWRFRSDSDGLSSWTIESTLGGNASGVATATFSTIGTTSGNLFLVRNRSTAIEHFYFNGNSWASGVTGSNSGANNAYISAATDGTNLWIIYPDATNISGSVSATAKLVYRKCTPPYHTFTCDATSTPINSYQDFFTQVWLYNGSTYEDLSTAASNSTTADVKHSVSGALVKNIGDIAYLGQTQQFDAFSVALSTNGTVGTVAWEYCSAADGSGACTTWSTLTLTASSASTFGSSGWGAFTAPGDWVTSKVNSEATAKYYVRARTTGNYTVAPIAFQAMSAAVVNWASFTSSPSSGTLYGIWTENGASVTKVRSGTISVTANTTASSADINPVVGYSSVNTATQAPFQRRTVRTSDGTLHAFFQSGTHLACGGSTSANNKTGLNWLNSTDDGATWNCQGQLNSDTSVNFYYASATTDTSDNIYVVYSPVVATGGTTKNVYYRKISYNGSSAWTLGAEQTLLAGTSTIGYAYATIERENTNSRLWITARYYDGANYQSTVYYSSNLSDTPTWTQSVANLETAGTNSSTGHFSTLVRFGSKMGVIYLDNAGGAKWRYRSDADGLTTWSAEMIPNLSGAALTVSGTTFTAVGTEDGRVFFAINNNNINLYHYNGLSWSGGTTLSSTGGASYIALSTDGTNAWVVWGDTTGLSGLLSGSRRLMYRRCGFPYDLGSCDATASRVVAAHDIFDKVWTYASSAYADVTTAAGNTTTNDTAMPSVSGDSMYFGKSTKFDSMSWGLTTLSSGGTFAWEYWNGSAWVPLSNVSAATQINFSNHGYFTFTPNSDWTATSVNGEPTPYYYIRARLLTSFVTTPVGVQFVAIPFTSWAAAISSPYSNAVRMLWTENAAAPTRVRTSSVAVTTGTPPVADAADIDPTVISRLPSASAMALGPRIARTSDGTLHVVQYVGNLLTTCGGSQVTGGLLYFNSTDNGSTWTCRAQLGTLSTPASLTADANDNLFTVYQGAGSGTGADIFYRKFTYAGSSTWTIGAEQIAADSVGATTAYAWASIIPEGTTRLWIATRYYDGTNYQVSVYYSSDMSAAPTWTVSQTALDTPQSSNGALKHYASIARFGSKIGVVYNNFGGVTGGLQWRWRNDSDPLTTWSTESYAYPFAQGTQSQPVFQAVGTPDGQVFIATGTDQSSNAIYFIHYNGTSWETPIPITGSAINATASLVADNSTAWIFYADTNGISNGLTSVSRTSYKKCVAPFTANDCDTAPTRVVSRQAPFDKVWSNVASTYTDVTTAAGNVAQTDTQMVSSAGDAIYFGQSTKFDAVNFDLSTVGTNGRVAWEYWNGSSWVSLNTELIQSNVNFSADGYFYFVPNTDWQKTTVNGESTSYYYVRARVLTSFGVAPVAAQIVPIPLNGSYSAVPSPANNSIFFTWLENNAPAYRSRFAAVSTTTSSSGTTTATSTGSTASSNNPQWWNDAWAWRKQLYFKNTESNLGVSGDTLTNFPVMIKLTAGNFDFSRVQNAGQDLRFVDPDNATALPYEIEQWDSAAQTATVWVKVPQIDGNTDTDSIYMYYGNPSATDAQSPHSTWDSSFASVWHMTESGTTINDSTSNNHIGYKLADTQPSQATGYIGSGQQFNGANNDNIAVPSMLGQTLPFTISVWAKPGSEKTCIEGLFDTAANTAGTIRNYSYGCGYGTAFEWHNGNPASIIPVDMSTWTHFDVSFSFDGLRQMKVYKNGLLVSSASGTSANSFAWSNLHIGNANSGIVNPSNSGQNFYGLMDEFRVSSTVRSDGWIAADYKSQNNQFVNYAGDNVNPAASFTVGSSISQGENGALRISGTASSSQSSFLLSGIQCSVNGGAFKDAKATDGSFNSVQEDFYFDFKQTDNDWQGSGYSIRCQAMRSGRVVLDNMFFFTPISLQSPANADVVSAQLPTFVFNVLKQKQILAENVQKFQIEVRRGGSESTAEWQTYLDEIPLPHDGSKQEDALENEYLRAEYKNDLSEYRITPKLNPLSGRYSWRVVAVDKSGHKIYSDSQTFTVRTGDAISLNDFTYSASFPLTLRSVTGLGNMNLSTFWPNRRKSSYTLSSTSPTFFGIAYAHSKILLEIAELNCTTDTQANAQSKVPCTRTFTTVTNPSSQFGITLPKNTLQSGKKYVVTLAASDGNLYTELPTFQMNVSISAYQRAFGEVTERLSPTRLAPELGTKPTATLAPKASPTPPASDAKNASKRCILWWCW